MSKYKASWKLYSSRRKITLESLITAGKVSDYKTYTTYCETFQVEPMSEKDFLSQTHDALPDKPKKQALTPEPSLSPEAPEPEETPISATVWLAGIEDETLVHEVPVSSKKKKAKDTGSESSN